MASSPYLAPSATFRNDVYVSSVQGVTHRFATFGLLSGLYGVLTVLSILSICTLIQRVKTSTTAIILSLTILALVTSTTIYVVASFLNYQTSELTGLVTSGQELWSYSPTVMFPPDSLTHIKGHTQLYTCASSAALTINVTLADAIVCWRACVVWHRTRAVHVICAIFLLGTFVLGALDTSRSCASGRPPRSRGNFTVDSYPTPGVLSVGLAACVLSLSTNLLATLLVGYKTWRLRRRLRGYLVAKVGGSRTGKLLSLLVESGAVYCAIWVLIVPISARVLIVAFQADVYRSMLVPGPPNPTGAFQGVFHLFVDGCLVPLVALYPTIIIVLIAFDKSHIEKGLTQHTEDEQLKPARMLHTDFIPRGGPGCDRRPPQAQSWEVQVVDLDRFDSRLCNGVADASRRTAEEWKAAGIV
ncbi:hypothetical protein GSI_09817 [Ganoderma sinense ZZ0214-1]|uniref:Uncharacterized protein n=1 Tax=Ganoderma sinense ZZ0214-1 TaxID=1077348 RepID=A0A2G8S2U1_9APHY|nr:hypothetical protein GSI_09817 [Ganoderma sinense ZZ0214-1]